MQRKFIHNLFFVLFLNLLVKPFWILGIDRAVQNRVGANEYGLYASIFSFAILLNIVLDFGITSYNSRNIAQHGHMLRRYFSGVFNVKLILALIYIVATLLFGLIIGYEARAFWLLMLLGVNQVLLSMILYLRSNISGLHLFKTDGMLSVLDRVLMIVLCSILLWSNYFNGEFKIEWFAYAQFWAYLLTFLIAFFLVYHKAQFYKLRIDIKLFRIILKQSLPFALLVLLMSFYYRLDAVMIERLLPDGLFQAGVYAQAYRLLESFNMFGYLFATLLLPIFSRMLKNKDTVAPLVQTSFNLIFIPSVAVVVASSLYSYEIMDLLYTNNLVISSELYSILILSFIATALTYIYGTLLTANGSLKALNIIAFVGMLLNLTMNWLAIPKYGAWGAAMATLITQTFVIIIQIIVSKKLLQMAYRLSFIVKHLLLVSIGIAGAYYSKPFFQDFKLHAVLILCLFGILAVLFGFVRKADILKVVRSS